jgi:myo-inositol-1-phosphate synthase
MRAAGQSQSTSDDGRERIGVAVVGLGGAVATTAIAGIEMIKAGRNDRTGLPLAGLSIPGLADYRDIVFTGWDVNGDDLGVAAEKHAVLDRDQVDGAGSALRGIRPMPAVGSSAYCRNVDGENKIVVKSHRDAVERIGDDLARFKRESGVDRVIMLNLASTERHPDRDAAALRDLASFEKALDSSDAEVGPAMLYAYAAIANGAAYANFTPSVAADAKPLIEMARERNVAVAGKDGKTGQTFLKTVIAPALRQRALHVDGWFSTNILGNRDGLALDDPNSLKSKLGTKKSVLDQMLGYEVEDHIIDIRYYRPRGDDKEAWDNIDISGFMGQRMQIKVNFLCKDSILAAPLAIEIVRCLGLAARRGEGGVQEQLGSFFKAPMTGNGHLPEHGFHAQQIALMEWLGAEGAEVDAA